MIVATAGHIDHGKTRLVKALTGIDADRLPEEKRRGLSIDLGFAYQPLDDGSVLGFVDVPGHERFIRNMLAGVTGVDYALLVVAADDGPMPQTEEHRAILDLLGVARGVVALTKIDRVDDQRIAEVTGRIESLLAATGLAGSPVMPVSGLTGAGVPALKAHLEEAARHFAERSAGGHFRLAVDRCFTLPGAGLIVTGTVFSGTVETGDRLILSPAGTAARVRGIHAQNRESDTGRAGERCALNLTGLRKAGVSRGDWLLAASVHAPVRRLDARVRVLVAEKKPLRHGTRLHLHLGAAEVTARAALLEGRSIAPGGEALVQLVLDEEIGALSGDRLILRDRAARRTIGGGVVVDPFAPARNRGKPERLAFLRAMAGDSAAQALAALVAEAPAGVDLARFAQAWNLGPEETANLWRATEMVRIGPSEAGVGLSPERWDALRGEILTALRAWHDRAPDDDPGAPEETLRKALAGPVPAAVFNALVLDLIEAGGVERSGARLRLPGHRPAMGAADATLWARIEPLLEAGDLRPPGVHAIASELAVDPKAVERLLKRGARLGLVVRVAENRFFPPRTVLRLGRIAEYLAAQAADARFAAAAFRDRSGIGRNLTISVLEYFDKAGFTVRAGDSRRIVKPAAEIFAAAAS